MLLKTMWMNISLRQNHYLLNSHIFYFFYNDVYYYFIHGFKIFLLYVVLTRTYKTNHNALLANSWRRRVLEQCYTLAYFKTYLLILYGWGSPEEYHKNHSRIHTALISFLLVGIAVISLENTLCIISWLVKKGWCES